VPKAKIIREKPKVINVGIVSFYEALKDQGVEVVHVDWKPPAGGDPDLIRLLEKLKDL
jgi:FdrA protein